MWHSFQDIHFELSRDHGCLPKRIEIVERSPGGQRLWWRVQVDHFVSPAPNTWFPVDFTLTLFHRKGADEFQNQARYVVGPKTLVINKEIPKSEFTFQFPNDGSYYDWRTKTRHGATSQFRKSTKP